MVRLRKITISGFRGARYPLTLDLTASCRSVAIFGENASGKSTITDGIEWFFYDKVEHLWREDCKEDALRNVHLDEKDDALVSLDFSNKELSGEKRLSKKLARLESNKSKPFEEYKKRAANERLVLRTAHLTDFINKRKGEKRKELADIIGYQALIEFRGLIVAGLNSLEKDTEYAYAKKNQPVAQGKLMKLAGTVLVSEDELFAKANELVKPFKPKVRVADDKSYSQCIEELKEKIGQQEKARTQLNLGELKKACEMLRRAVKAATDSKDKFLQPYNSLVKNKEKIKLLDIEQFLSRGKDILDRKLSEPDKCPFCGSEVDLDHVKEEVAKRIRELESLRVEFEKTTSAKDQWLINLREVTRLAAELERKWAGLEVTPEFVSLVKNAGARSLTLAKSIEEKFPHYGDIQEEPEENETVKGLVASLEARMKKADDEVKALELTKEESAIVETIQALNDMRSAFGEYWKSTKTKQAFEKQIKTLAKIKDEFIKVQNAAFEDVLDIMSSDISNYYIALHPPKRENVDNVKLRIVGEEGIEFEYSFHGKTTYPPMKYLSESHLNSLGLALFLASVKLFNKENNFFILDDVVTSFDAGHRIRLLRLLQDEFKDWQILLLTHERHWFEIIKKELASGGWIICEVDWDQENGVQLRGVPADLKGLIEIKRSQGHEVANDVRILLEAVLKEICHSLQVKMAFRLNERNEERMTGELLSELRRTLNEKAPTIKDHPIFKQIETSNLLGTKGSHDRPKEISKGDIDIALEDIDKLEALFRCEECDHLVSRERHNEVEKKLTCKCGKHAIDWKA